MGRVVIVVVLDNGTIKASVGAVLLNNKENDGINDIRLTSRRTYRKEDYCLQVILFC